MAASDCFEFFSFIIHPEGETWLFKGIPLLVARGVKEMVVRELHQQMIQYQMMDRINWRHVIRQVDINRYYNKNRIC